jgi:hypothetical protein
VLRYAVANVPKIISLYSEKNSWDKNIKNRPLDQGLYPCWSWFLQNLVVCQSCGKWRIFRIKNSKKYGSCNCFIEEGISKTNKEGFIGKTVNERIERLLGKDYTIVKIASKEEHTKESRKWWDESKSCCSCNETEEKYHIYIINIGKDV